MRLSNKYVLIVSVIASINVFGQEPIYENTEQAKVLIDSLKTNREGSFQLTVPGNLPQEKLTLIDLQPNNAVPGIELAVYDGDDWRRFISVVDSNGRLHWHDAFTNADLDNYSLSPEWTMAYKLPEEVTYLSCKGIIQQPLCGPMSVLELSVSEVNARNRLLVSISTIRNNAGDTMRTKIPTRLQVHLANGETLKAVYSQTAGKIMVQGGGIIDDACGMDFSLEVDSDAKAGTGWNNLTIATFKLDELARRKGIELNDVYNAIAKRTIDEQERRQNELSVLRLTKRETTTIIWSAIVSLLLSAIIWIFTKLPFRISIVRKVPQNKSQRAKRQNSKRK